MSSVLITGGSGMLGTDLRQVLVSRGFEIESPSSTELDIAQPQSVAEIAAERWGRPEWLINCAAYTAVDRAESEADRAAALNTLGPAYLAQVCALKGIRLLHVSTDFVFDGSRIGAYPEDAPTCPLGVYGRTKRDGEEAVLTHAPQSLVVRTAWLYGAHGSCFPKTIIRAWLAGKALRVVSDQVGNPTYTAELARVLADLVTLAPEGGIYHASGPDAMTWHRFALEAIEVFHSVIGAMPHAIEIEPILARDWPTPTQRPANSSLDFGKLASLGIQRMEPLRTSLRGFAVRWLEIDEELRSSLRMR